MIVYNDEGRIIEPLFFGFHRLNRPEAFRRLRYWMSNSDRPSAMAAISILVNRLEKDEDAEENRL
jgi:hypothetical protein